ncbi:MAG: GNAT family N-acetyltransferase [Deltaproteobacteria bacterium]
MNLNDDKILLRKLVFDDAPSMALQANNYNVAKNLRNAFPHPYTIKDAEFFIENIANNPNNYIFGIFTENDYCGNIGIHPGEDVYQKTAEIGYFIGESFWNKGITTRAVRLISEFGFNSLNLIKLWAGVFEYNAASMRVLEKCGYEREAILKKSVFKNGSICDEHRYARYKE